MSDSATRPISDEEWEDLVRQLPNQPKAQPRPFFYTRVQARLVADAEAPRPALPGWLRRPAYAAVLGMLLMTLSGDGSTLRPAAEANPCDACPGSPPPQALQR